MSAGGGLSNLQGLSRQAIKRTAISLAAILFAALNVLIIGPLRDSRDHDGVSVLAVVLLSAVGLATFVTLLERVLLRHWAKPILGTWLYVSDSGNYGLANIQFHGDELFYLVELYLSPEEVLGAYDGGPGARTQFFARALSRAVAYDPSQHELRLIYRIQDTTPPYKPREGMLVLTVHDSRSLWMKGFWKSDYDDPRDGGPGGSGEVKRTGWLKLFRPEEFRRTLTENPSILRPPVEVAGEDSST